MRKLRVTCPVDKLTFMQIGDIITDYKVVNDNFNPPSIKVNTSNYAKDNKFKENGRFMWWASESFWIGFSNVEVIEEGERKMKYELRDTAKSWWVEGMIVKGKKRERSGILEIDSADICKLNKDIMTKEQIIECMEYPRYGWGGDYLKPLEPVKLTRLEYEILKYTQKQGAKYICKDEDIEVRISKKKPERGSCVWLTVGPDMVHLKGYLENLFKFVKWEDEPRLIEDILDNYEIVEDE